MIRSASSSLISTFPVTGCPSSIYIYLTIHIYCTMQFLSNFYTLMETLSCSLTCWTQPKALQNVITHTRTGWFVSTLSIIEWRRKQEDAKKRTFIFTFFAISIYSNNHNIAFRHKDLIGEGATYFNENNLVCVLVNFRLHSCVQEMRTQYLVFRIHVFVHSVWNYFFYCIFRNNGPVKLCSLLSVCLLCFFGLRRPLRCGIMKKIPLRLPLDDVGKWKRFPYVFLLDNVGKWKSFTETHAAVQKRSFHFHRSWGLL